MQRYVWRRRRDGTQIINLGITWEKLVLAARIIVAIENPEDVLAISARPFGQRAVFKFAQNTGSQYIGGRYTPGALSNPHTTDYKEPRLLIATDPLVDHQPIKEASYVNIPTIAFCDTDAPTKFIDVVIPGNNKSKTSIALLYWLLAREVLRMRNVIRRTEPWSVMVDLFMHREDVAEKKAEGDAAEDGGHHAREYDEEAPAKNAGWAGDHHHHDAAPVEQEAPSGPDWQPAAAAPSTWNQEDF